MSIGPLLSPYTPPKTFHCNCSIHLSAALKRWGWREARGEEPAEFAYWDIFGNTPHVQACVNVWPRECTNVLDNLYPFFRRLHEIPGLRQANVVPVTYIGNDWRKLTREEFQQAPDSLWFLKDVFGVRGKGITAVNTYEDYLREVRSRPANPCTIQGPNSKQEHIADRNLIQHAIRDVLTIAGGKDGHGRSWSKVPYSAGGRKTCLRAYFLTRGDGAIFLCEEMICYVHGVPYDPTSTDDTVQSVHGTQVDSGRDNFMLSTWDDTQSAQAILNNCMQCGKELVPLWHDVMSEHKEPLCDAAGQSDSDNNHCHMLWHFWGVDFMVSMDNSVQLLEMNAWCNLYHKTPGEIALHELMDRGIMEILGFSEHIPPGPQPWKQLCEPLYHCVNMPYYAIVNTVQDRHLDVEPEPQGSSTGRVQAEFSSAQGSSE